MKDLNLVIKDIGSRLTFAGLSRKRREEVIDDIRSRVVDLLDAYRQGAFEQITFPSLELASFYEPLEASLDARLLVAAAIRNSLLEKYHAKPYEIIRHDAILDINFISISNIDRIGMQPLSDNITPNNSRPAWQDLAYRFPAAWHAFGALNKLSSGGTANHQPVLPGEILELPTTSLYKGGMRQTKLSGIDPLIDADLAAQLNFVKCAGKDGMAFFFTFSRLSREIENVMKVIEFILSHKALFVTLNVVIGPDFVIRRKNFIGYPRDIDQWKNSLDDDFDVDIRHKELIDVARKEARKCFQ